MLPFVKIVVMVFCLVFVFFTVVGCTPDAKDKMNLPNKDSVSTSDGEESTDIGNSFSDSQQELPDETDPEVVWTPFV